ncbi:MAG: hypothetical protein J6X67_00405 [Treponema sp.]|nr:hypothetical protein [Treponema sp.]
MKSKLRFFLSLCVFSFFSCKTTPKNFFKITNTEESQVILLETLTEKNVFKLRIEIEGNINGNAEILINDVDSRDGTGMKFDLEPKNLGKILDMDWYSNQCYITYIPNEIISPSSGEILIRYEFLAM